MSTVEERLASVEASMEHVATKTDLAELKADLMSQLTWRMFGMVVGLMVGIASVVAVVQSVFD